MLSELLGCLAALNHYETSNWWQRFRAWRLRRKGYRKLLKLGGWLQFNADRWHDRCDFEKNQFQVRS